MPRRLACLWAALLLLSSPAGFAAAEYTIQITATDPYFDLMQQAAHQITQQPGFRQRYPAGQYMLIGAAYAWSSPGGCFAVAGFTLLDLRNNSNSQSGDFSFADTRDLGCPNYATLSVVSSAQQLATQIFMRAQ